MTVERALCPRSLRSSGVSWALSTRAQTFGWGGSQLVVAREVSG